VLLHFVDQEESPFESNSMSRMFITCRTTYKTLRVLIVTDLSITLFPAAVGLTRVTISRNDIDKHYWTKIISTLLNPKKILSWWNNYRVIEKVSCF